MKRSTIMRVWLASALLVGLGAACRPGQPLASPPPAGTGTGRTPPAAVYYVSPAGSDADPGSLDHPWRTLQKAADTLTAGETVWIRAGTYHERLWPSNSGEPGGEITFAAFPGETVTIDGSGIELPDDLAGLVEVDGRSYIHISGLRVINAGPHDDDAGIMILDSSYVTVEDNATYNTNSSGIGVWRSRHVSASGNRVEQAAGGGWQECISIAGTDTFTVADNTVVDCHKEGICIKDGSAYGQVYSNQVERTRKVGIYIDAWDKYTHDIQVFSNRVHDTDNDGFALASEMGGLLENIRLANNLAYHNRFVGLHISQNGDSKIHPMRNLVLINNTAVANGVGGWGGGIAVDSDEVSGVVVRNNLVSDNLTFQIDIGSRAPGDQIEVDHNLINAFRGSEAEVRGQDPIEGDPRFVDAGNGDFHLLPASPAVDAGSPVDAPGTDFDGHLRPQDGNGDGVALPDIGAFERTPGIQ